MTAVDTNVVVRLLTGDDPKQSRSARALFLSNPIWISKTVFLETAWVLSKIYGFEDQNIVDAFTKLLGLDNVGTEDAGSIVEALALTLHGVEIADAIHLASRPSGASFVTFDKAFARNANRAGVSRVTLLPA